MTRSCEQAKKSSLRKHRSPWQAPCILLVEKGFLNPKAIFVLETEIPSAGNQLGLHEDAILFLERNSHSDGAAGRF